MLKTAPIKQLVSKQDKERVIGYMVGQVEQGRKKDKNHAKYKNIPKLVPLAWSDWPILPPDKKC